jgi:hypothetical protein
VLTIPLAVGWSQLSDPALDTATVDNLNGSVGVGAVLGNSRGRAFLVGFDSSFTNIGDGYDPADAIRWNARLLYTTPVSERVILNFGTVYAPDVFAYPLPVFGAVWTMSPKWTLSGILPMQAAMRFTPNELTRFGIVSSPAGVFTNIDGGANPLSDDRATYNSLGMRVALEATRFLRHTGGQLGVEVGTTVLRTATINSRSQELDSSPPPSLHVALRVGWAAGQ